MTSGFMGIAFNFIKSAMRSSANNQGHQPFKPKPSTVPNPNGYKVGYETTGREGKVIFEGEGQRFAMYWEFGGGDVITIVYVPPVEKWVEHTHIPLEKRQEVLDFIGRETVRLKISSNGSYKLENNTLLFYA
ncbi:MAG: hypothetical protein GC192_14955 [Bacteroidetes bacterium]|nr:hypothetical protein [Bacteroidota bacterium]